MLEKLTTIYDPKGYYIDNCSILGTRIYRASPDYIDYDTKYCNALLSIDCKIIKVVSRYEDTFNMSDDNTFVYYIITDFGNNDIFKIAKVLGNDLIISYCEHTIIIKDDYY